jgi:hypothetical protein
MFNYSLGPEERLVLLLSRPKPEGAAVATAAAIMRDYPGSIDLKKLIRLATENGVAALIYENVKSLQLFPEEIMKRLENLYFLTCKNNVFHLNETIKILNCLQESGIEAIPLKGSIAADTIFGNLGLYPTADIDILIKPFEVERTGVTLEGIGYKKMIDLNHRDLFDSLYHVCYSNGAHIVEVHWNLVMRYFIVNSDFWWQDAKKVPYEGSKILFLSHERYALYTIFRLFSHAFRPLKFSSLVSALLFRYGKELDWQKLIACSELLKMKRLVFFTLRLMNNVHGNDIPSSVVENRIWGYLFFAKFVESGFFNTRGRNRPRMMFFLFLLDSPLAVVRVILRMIFPSIGEVRWRYGLSAKSKKVYMYYALNPLLMLLKKH